VTTAVLVGCSSGQLGGSGGAGSSFAGTSGAGGGGGTTGGEPLEMFPADYQTAYCSALVPCNLFPDMATCEAALHFPTHYDVRNIMASARSGAITYDPIAGAACIAAVSQGCTITSKNWYNQVEVADLLGALQEVPACIAAFEGAVPLGGTCRSNDLECAGPENFCDGSQGCTGVCVAAQPYIPLGTLGQACTDGVGCVLPAFCDGTTCVLPPGHLASCTTLYGCGYLDDYCGLAPGATATTCIPRLPPGSPCTLGASGAATPSGYADPCQQLGQCVAGVCVAYGEIGGACAANNECYSGLCTNGTCTANTATPPPDSCPIPM
jgi:hypothetical protein